MAGLYALVANRDPAYLSAVRLLMIIVVMALVSALRDDTKRYYSALQPRLDTQ